jgi:uncharacterized Zn-finger protein
VQEKKYIEIGADDLPLCCPQPQMVAWNSHPRVFLKIEQEPGQEIICPYCSTRYKLVATNA